MSKPVLDPITRLTYQNTTNSTSKQMSASCSLRHRTSECATQMAEKKQLMSMRASGSFPKDLNRAALKQMQKIKSKATASEAGFRQRTKSSARSKERPVKMILVQRARIKTQWKTT